MTDEEFIRISSYLKQRYGINMTQKKVIVNGRLENYIRHNGWGNYNEYMNAVENDVSGGLEKELLNLLTTNYTYFMREFEHFEFFKKNVLPWIKEKEGKTKDVRVWCGAASTGEEPYMIAMVLQDFFGLEAQSWDTKVLATDISVQVLQQAIAGSYSEDRLKSIPEHWKKKFFTKMQGGEIYQVKPELKQEVIFRQFNLMDPFPFKRKMHTIFLRNVMIYFDEKTKIDLLRKVYDLLEPGGYLFIGMTESLDRNAVPFKMIQPSIFKKEGGIN